MNLSVKSAASGVRGQIAIRVALLLVAATAALSAQPLLMASADETVSTAAEPSTAAAIPSVVGDVDEGEFWIDHIDVYYGEGSVTISGFVTAINIDPDTLEILFGGVLIGFVADVDELGTFELVVPNSISGPAFAEAWDNIGTYSEQVDFTI